MSKAQEVLTKMNVAAANLAAQLASEKLKEIGELAAASFYGDYSPKQYGRSYGLYGKQQGSYIHEPQRILPLFRNKPDC